MKKQSIVEDASKVLTKDDYIISMTSLMLKDLQKALQVIEGNKIERILDLGCGFGGMTKLVANFFSATEAYGVDINPDALKVAEKRGLRTINANLEKDKLPLPSDHFDLVISLGVIEHLPSYDNLISESYRVIKKGGYFLVSWPNLGSYTQRISLLLGYQPNEVEISKEVIVGTIYNSGTPSGGERGHIHSATLKAMKQLLEYYNFSVVGVKRGNPPIYGQYSSWSSLITTIGVLCPVSLSRRPIVIAKK